MGARMMSTGVTPTGGNNSSDLLTGAAADQTSTVAAIKPTLLSLSEPLDPNSWWSFLHWLPRGAQEIMIFIHDHLPEALATSWLPTIVVTTLVFRSLVFPLAVMQQKNTAGMSLMKPELKVLAERNAAIKSKYHVAGLQMPVAEMMRQRNEQKALFKKYNCSVSRGLIMPLVLMPTFIAMFTALRTMGYVDPSFLEGGVAWFQNLGALDPGYEDLSVSAGPLRLTLGLPALNAALVALSVKCNTELSAQSNSQMAQFMKKMMYIFAALSWPLCSSGVPAGVLVYWSVSNIYGIVQAAFLRSEFGKKLLGIPHVPTSFAEMDKSFEQMQSLWKQAKNPPQRVANTEAAVNPFEVKPRRPGTATSEDFNRKKRN